MTKKLPSPANQLPVPMELIERRIYLIRGQKVMLDNDLAELYQVPTKALNQAVRRNLDRFPEDFMFQLTDEEAGSLRSQIVTSNVSRGGRFWGMVHSETCANRAILVTGTHRLGPGEAS